MYSPTDSSTGSFCATTATLSPNVPDAFTRALAFLMSGPAYVEELFEL